MKTTQEVLANAEVTLNLARQGLADLLGQDPVRKQAGLRNAIAWGRSVTLVLQGLRSIDPTFENWYVRYQAEMKADPLLRFFRDRRNELLKEGTLSAATLLRIRNLRIPEDLGTPPPYATGAFVGGPGGSTGWHIELPDGTQGQYYVILPEHVATVTLLFPNPPDSHRGEPVSHLPAEQLVGLYLTYLESMLADAKRRFLTP